MNIDEMIVKWDEQVALHRRVCDDTLMCSKEDRIKNSHYAQAICTVLADLKKVKEFSLGAGVAGVLPVEKCNSCGSEKVKLIHRCEKCSTEW